MKAKINCIIDTDDILYIENTYMKIDGIIEIDNKTIRQIRIAMNKTEDDKNV